MVSLFAVVLAAAPVVVPPFVGSSPEVGLAAQSVLAQDLRANGLEVRTVDTDRPERWKKLEGAKVVVAGSFRLAGRVRAVIVVTVLDPRRPDRPLREARVKRWDERASLVTAVFDALKLSPPTPLVLEPVDDALLEAWGEVLSARDEPTAQQQLDALLAKWPRFTPALARKK